MDWKIYAFLYLVDLIVSYVYLRKMFKETRTSKPDLNDLLVLLTPTSSIIIMLMYFDLRDSPNPLQKFLNKLFGYKDKQD